MCAGVTGSITLPQNNPDCESQVQMFYLCKIMVKIDPSNQPSECFWKENFGGLLDNSYYGKNYRLRKLNLLNLFILKSVYLFLPYINNIYFR